MSFNLVDSVKSLFTNELVGKASAYTGESESGIAKAMSGILPVILGGLVDKTSSHEGADAIARAAREANHSGVTDQPGSFFDSDHPGLAGQGQDWLSSLFGETKSGMISSLISNFSGVKSSTTTSLMSMAAPVILGFLGKHAAANNLDAGGLSAMLNNQQSNIAAALPAGLNLSTVFGNTAATTNAAKTESTVHTAPVYPENNAGGGMKILMLVLLFALLAAAVFYLTKGGCNRSADETHAMKDTSTVSSGMGATTTMAPAGKLDSLSGDFVYDPGENVSLDLPGNAGTLTVGKNSTEYKLIQFLNDKSAMIDTVKGNWFEFTNVRFTTGKAELTETSMEQLKNLVTISKAYPSAQFKFGGYTDNVGNAANNVTLSQKRADAVAAMVQKLGAAATAFAGAKGYGDAFPIADNGTAEGKAQNRRVAVNVKAK